MAAPAAARDAQITLPAGALNEAAIALARATGTSIVVADPALARRAVPAITGRMDADEAVKRLARAAGARAQRIGPGAWRLVPGAPPRPAFVRRRPPPPPPAAPRPAPAAPEETVGEPIVVIASKRDTRLGELPGQVSFIQGEELERGGVGGTEKITQRIATVASTHLGSGRNKLFIRGIADSSFTGPTQATVGQYLGDLRLSYNAPDPDLRLSDMERVEVLEGPQGTLYGAGSLGGIIRMVPNQPELGVTGGTVTIGGALIESGDPAADLHATLNFGGERAAVRLNLDATRIGGYIDKPRTDQSDVNRTDILGGRIGARYEVAPDWSVELLALGQRTRAADSQYIIRERSTAKLVSDSLVGEGAGADYVHGQFVVSGRIGALHLRSTTGASWQHLTERFDATTDVSRAALFVQENRTRMIANETRIWQPLGRRFGWLAGVSFTDNETRLARFLGKVGAPEPRPGVLNKARELTGYGEASLRLFGPLIASAGVRVTNVRLDGQGFGVSGDAILPGAGNTEVSRKETAVLPSAALVAQLDRQSRIYVRYQEGFRPGGLTAFGDIVRFFQSDHAATWEVGAGIGAPGRGPFNVALSVARTRWTDIQADFIDSSGLPSTANIGEGLIWTATASGGIAIGSEVRLEAGASFNDSRVDIPMVAFQPTTQIPNIARFSGRAGITWSHPVSATLDLDAEAWASYIGKSRLGVGPELGAPQGNYLDSGATIRVGSPRWGVTASVTNIGDVEGNRFALGTPFASERDQLTPLQPRTFRLGFDARF